MPGTQAEKAAKWGVSVASISRWENGLQMPRDTAILAAIEAAGGPSPWEWEVMPDAAKPATPPAAPPAYSGPATADSVQREASRLLAMVQSGMTEAAAEPDLSRRMRILSDGANIVRQLGRVVGAGHVVTERQILESPIWRLLCERIINALAPWPDAIAAMAAAIEGTSAQPS
jgi:hypothetical protein